MQIVKWGWKYAFLWRSTIGLACMHALEKEMATHSSVLAWRIPGREEPGSSAINCSTSVVWMNACMHTWETSSVRWDLMGKRNLKCRHKLKESSSRERNFKFQYFVQKAVIIQTLGSHFEMFASRVKILLTDGVSSSFEKMLIFIRLSNVYPIIWLYHFWLYDEQLVVFKIECFNSSSIWSLRLLWQPPWKLWKALS